MCNVLAWKQNKKCNNANKYKYENKKKLWADRRRQSMWGLKHDINTTRTNTRQKLLHKTCDSSSNVQCLYEAVVQYNVDMYVYVHTGMTTRYTLKNIYCSPP